METLRIPAAIVFSVAMFMLIDGWIKEKGVTQEVIEKPITSVPESEDLVIEKALESSTSNNMSPLTLERPSGDTIHVLTDVYRAEIDSLGGQIKKLELLNHKGTIDKTKNFVLFDNGGRNIYLAQSGLLGEHLPNHKTNYKYEKTQYQFPDDSNKLVVPLAWEDASSGISVLQKIVFHRGSYVVDVEFEVDNKSNKVIDGTGYFQLLRDSNPPEGDSRMLPTYTGAAVYTDQQKFQKVDFDDIADGKVKYPTRSEDGWIAMVQHYFVAAWVREESGLRAFYTKAVGDGLYSAGVKFPLGKIETNSVGVVKGQLYAGPQDQKRMSELTTGLDLTVDYGWLTIIAAPIFAVLSWIQSWAINWGLSIVILTMFIKLLFYPLSAASYKSMARMRVVAPKLQKFKELYGDDRQKMQQAMMELYKKEKINPLGGCLPILVQIPVFIALYWVLLASVELRHAPFILWIDDLSATDPYYVLPILMGLSMIVQSYINPTPPDPVQAKIMKIMPVVFSVFFFFFPAGLVLYWLVNNLLSIAQQWQIMRVIERSSPANVSG